MILVMKMEIIFINIMLVFFPILIYLVLSCFNLLIDKKVTKWIFVMTMATSLYLSLRYNLYFGNNNLLLIFCNIPILICYLKKRIILGIGFTILFLGLLNTYQGDIMIVTVLKYMIYLIIYVCLYRSKYFDYLFFKIVAVVQGFLLSFEYFYDIQEFTMLIELLILAIVIYIVTFLSIYLFKLADDISNMHGMINTAKKEIEVKNSLFKLTHEVKNPIAVCKGYLDMMDINNIEKVERYTGIIKEEINRSLNIMNDFMECSKLKIQKEEFDMNVLLDSVYDSFKILGKSKNIKMIYENDNDEIYINGDYHRLEQVLVNIIKNSIESITDNGIIELGVEIIDKQVKIKVRDNGIGMTNDELEKVTEMFYTTKKDGTGLGVALSREIILAHNGEIKYDSEKGGGTVCTVTIPV